MGIHKFSKLRKKAGLVGDLLSFNIKLWITRIEEKGVWARGEACVKRIVFTETMS